MVAAAAAAAGNTSAVGRYARMLRSVFTEVIQCAYGSDWSAVDDVGLYLIDAHSP